MESEPQRLDTTGMIVQACDRSGHTCGIYFTDQPGLFSPAILVFPDDFFPGNRNVFRRVDPNLDLVALDTNDGNGDVVADSDLFVDAS